MSVDPLADKYPGWNPYHYVHNNPIRLIDPTGMEAEWEPDKQGNLIAEKGDNWETLSSNYGYNRAQAKILIGENSVEYDSDGNVKAGQKLVVDNQFTRSIANSKTGNCHGCAYNGSQGREAEGFLNGGTMDEYLLSQYEPVSDSELIPGKSIGRFGGELNLPDVHDIENINLHSVVYYGKSKNGTKFVYQKPRMGIDQAEVVKLINVNGYGKLQGAPKTPKSRTNRTPLSGHTGWYNPK